MSDWPTKFQKRQDNTLRFKKETRIKLNIIKYISSNSTLQCNLIEGPYIYKVTGVLGDLWGSPQKYLSIVGSEIKILKAKGSKKKECAQKSNKSVRTVALSLHGILC